MSSKSYPKYPAGVTRYWIYFCLTEAQRDSSCGNAILPRERPYQSMSTVQATASVGLSIFWFSVKGVGEQNRATITQSGKGAVSPGLLNISHKTKFPRAEKGIRRVLHLN